MQPDEPGICTGASLAAGAALALGLTLLALPAMAGDPPQVTSPEAGAGDGATQTAAIPEAPAFRQSGHASWYGPGFHGRKTASGKPFDQNAMTAAHRTLPLGTEVKVTNLATGRVVVVLINDRGPYIDGRIIDVSKRAAAELGMVEAGVVPVHVEAVEETPVAAEVADLQPAQP